MEPVMSKLKDASRRSQVMTQEGRGEPVGPPNTVFCKEKNRLLNEFLSTIHNLVQVQEQQTQAVIDGDPDFARFDVLLHMATERKENAKYAWIAHVESHHCGEA
jgi:hypothetical protein